MTRNTCPVRAPGGVGEPEDLRSVNGELTVDLTLRNYKEDDGSTRCCYTTPDGKESPNLRLNPGDLFILNLKNDLTEPGGAASAGNHHLHGDSGNDPCASGLMTATSTNLHFHGLTIPSTCHQDEVLKTSIQPRDSPFQYRFRVPAEEPPGLYWYHPHIHGFSKAQVLGGASGAIIVEGIERAVKELAEMPERGGTTTEEGSTAMGFYNVQQGDVPYFTSLANQHAMSDNFHHSFSVARARTISC